MIKKGPYKANQKLDFCNKKNYCGNSTILTWRSLWSTEFSTKIHWNIRLVTSDFYHMLGIFKIALRLRDWHVFVWQSVKVSNVFNTLTLKQIFWKTKTFFKKLEYRIFVEITKIESTSFPFKTALSVANVNPHMHKLGPRGPTHCIFGD